MSAKKSVAEIAYAIWKQEGCPPDRSLEHWSRAEALHHKSSMPEAVSGDVVEEIEPKLSGTIQTTVEVAAFEFGSSDQSNWLISSVGLGAAESWGRWTVQPVAMFDVPLRPSTRPSKMTLMIGAMVVAGSAPIKASLTIESEPIEVLDFIGPKSIDVSRREIKLSSLSPSAFSGSSLRVMFVIDNPRSPKSLGVNTDQRNLGLSLAKLEVEYASSA